MWTAIGFHVLSPLLQINTCSIDNLVNNDSVSKGYVIPSDVGVSGITTTGGLASNYR